MWLFSFFSPNYFNSLCTTVAIYIYLQITSNIMVYFDFTSNIDTFNYINITKKHGNTQHFNKYIQEHYLKYGIVGLESVILLISFIQLIRFSKFNRLYLKKSMHTLIICQMIVCIILKTVEMSDGVRELVEEGGFVFSLLMYLAMILFWCDFHMKLTRGFGMPFLQTPTFVGLIGGYVVVYMLTFGYLKQCTFPFYFSIGWWHATCYGVAMIAMFWTTLSILTTIRSLYFTVRTKFFRKTAEILGLVCCCFVFRLLGSLFMIPGMRPSSFNSEIGLILIYLQEKIIPLCVFMILLRKVPSNGKSSSRSENLMNLYSNLPLNSAA